MEKTWKRPFIPVIHFLGRRIESRHVSEAPVFVGGSARSGTTLLLSILSAHEKLFCHPEEVGIFNTYTRNPQGDIVPGRLYRHYKSLIWNHIPSTATRWCEKTPMNIHRIEVIDQYFGGQFKFIQIIRDGRDVILSKHPTKKNEYWVNPDRWIRDLEAGIKYLDDPRVHSIHYEDLIRNTEETLKNICVFLELEYSDHLAHWHKHARVTRNRALYSRIQKISDSSIGKWKTEGVAERVRTLTSDPRGHELLKKVGYLS